LRRFDVAYFAASVDTPETNAKFSESLGLDFPILSDPTKEAARAYGVLSATGMASRWTFYVGKDGRIASIDRKVAAGTHGEEIVRTLASLK
jgi:peroxiredoxin Q/BCP